MGRRTSMKSSRADAVFNFFNTILLLITFLLVVLPLYFIVIASVSSPEAVYSGEVRLVPRDITLAGYERIFQDRSIWTGYRNSIVYAALGTLLNVIVTMAAAYPLSRKKFKGRTVITFFFLITMYFNGGLIPTYLVVRGLGLLNRWPVMVILGMVSVWNLIIARTFFQQAVPDELYEAAAIDGCEHIPFFFKNRLAPLGSYRRRPGPFLRRCTLERVFQSAYLSQR